MLQTALFGTDLAVLSVRLVKIQFEANGTE